MKNFYLQEDAEDEDGYDDGPEEEEVEDRDGEKKSEDVQPEKAQTSDQPSEVAANPKQIDPPAPAIPESNQENLESEKKVSGSNPDNTSALQSATPEAARDLTSFRNFDEIYPL